METKNYKVIKRGIWVNNPDPDTRKKIKKVEIPLGAIIPLTKEKAKPWPTKVQLVVKSVDLPTLDDDAPPPQTNEGD